MAEPMAQATTTTTPARTAAWRDYIALGKPRLAGLVLFSAVIGYVMGAKGEVWDVRIIWVVVGGWLLTAGANAMNQAMEGRWDALMRRTQNRPIPGGRLTAGQAFVYAGTMSLAGLLVLTFGLNAYAGVLGMASLISYAFIYTPLKRIHPIGVFVGAVPGALPPLIGWVAATGGFEAMGLALFGMQFVWQFPHFFAIGWVGYEDYNRAGYKMLPAAGGPNRANAAWIFVSAIAVIFTGLVPYWLGLIGTGATVGLAVLGVVFSLAAANHWQNPSRSGALEVMFASFFYLPLAQLIVLFDYLA